MKPRLWTGILIFISGYIPLWIIFLVQNLNCEKIIGFTISAIALIISIIACIVLWIILNNIRSPYPKVKITAVNDKSKELLTYTLPYIASLIGLDINNMLYAISFGIFLLFMFLVSYNTDSIYHNPILILMGYCITEIEYTDSSLNCKQTVLLIVKKSDKASLLNNKVKISKINSNTFIMSARDNR